MPESQYLLGGSQISFTGRLSGEFALNSQQEGEDSEGVTSNIGIMQALVSVFLDEGDKIRCINAGSTRITFLLRSPLYYVCVSSWGEPESVVSYIFVLIICPGSACCRH